MSILFVGDSLDTLNLSFDGSLFLARAFQNLKKKIYWTTSNDLFWSGTKLFCEALELKTFQRGEKPEGSRLLVSLDSLKLILIRKDPPFDDQYLRLCWMLATLEKKISFVNRPSVLARYHEKMLPYEAVAQGFLKTQDVNPMGLVQSRVGLERFLSENPDHEFVRKPWLGYAGHRVEKIARSELANWNPASVAADVILQPFDDAVTKTGDRRVFFLRGKHIGDFARMPKPGGFVSNTAQGGSYELRPLDAKEKKLIVKVERFLKAIKVDFAGADFIGGRLNEVNITSPTGFAPYFELTGKDLSPLCVKRFLQ